MHCGEHCGQAGTELRVAGNGFIAQLGEVVGTPIPLQAGNEQHVEGSLRGWKWNGPDVLEKRITQCAYRLNSFLEFFGRAVVAPHDCAHFFEMKMLGKHRGGWHGKESEEASYFLWSILDEIAPGAQDGCSFFQGPESRAEANSANRVQAEFEG